MAGLAEQFGAELGAEIDAAIGVVSGAIIGGIVGGVGGSMGCTWLGSNLIDSFYNIWQLTICTKISVWEKLFTQ